MGEIKKAGKEVLLYSLVTTIPVILGFISIPIYTRIFNPVEYGQLSLVQMTANYTIIFMITWVNTSFLRFFEHYRKKDAKNEFVSNYIIMAVSTIIISLVVYGIFLVLANQLEWFSPSFMKLYVIGAALLVFNGSINFLQTFYRTQRKAFVFTGLSVFYSVLSLLFGLILVIYFGMGVEGIIFGTSIVAAIITFILAIKIFREYEVKIRLFNTKYLKEAFTYGLPVVISGLSSWILRYSDRYIIEFARSTEEVGIYSVSYNISEKTLMLFVTAISLAISPVLISTWENKGRVETEKILKYFSRFQFSILLPAAVGLIVMAPSVVSLLVGEQFHEGILATQIVVGGVFFWGLYSLTYTGLYLEKKTKVIARNVLVVSILNIFLNIVFVPKFGYIAAAYNTVLTYFLLWLISYFQTRKILKWSIDPLSFTRIVISVIVMLIVIIYSGIYLKSSVFGIALQIGLGLLVYVFFLAILGELKEELSVIKKYLLKRRSDV